MNKTILIIILAFSFLLGVFSRGIWSNWDILKASFFSVRYIEFLQLYATIVIAVYITYFVHNKASHDIKRREIYFNLISSVQETCNDAYQLGCNYIKIPNNEKTDEKRNKLTRLFKTIDIFLDMISSSDRAYIKDSDLYDKFLAFKIAVTGKPFTIASSVMPDQLLANIDSKYIALLSNLHKCKIELFP